MTRPNLIALASSLVAAGLISTGAFAQECPNPPENDIIDFGAQEPLLIASGEVRYAFSVEIADTPAEAARGLMYRPEIAADFGMLFVFEEASVHGFYMRNTCASLDILYLKADGRIASIVHNAVPFSERSLPSPGPVSGVLELAAGRADELDVRPGDYVIHAAFGGNPVWDGGSAAENIEESAIEEPASLAPDDALTVNPADDDTD